MTSTTFTLAARSALTWSFMLTAIRCMIDFWKVLRAAK